MPDPRLPKTCIIGAGSSGIAAAKVLAECGVPFDCFEKSDRVGGNWVFQNTNGMSSAYRSLHINTSRDKMAYSDFPMPREFPDYPHHAQIAAYFDAYVEHFGNIAGISVTVLDCTPSVRHGNFCDSTGLHPVSETR